MACEYTLQSHIYGNIPKSVFIIQCSCDILLAYAVLLRVVAKSRNKVNTFEMAQHYRVLTNDPIASVILGKPFFYFLAFVIALAFIR